MEKEPKPYDFELPEPYKIEEPVVPYLSKPKLYTYADYMTWTDDKRRELIRGVIYDLLSAPTRLHAKLSGKIFNMATNFVNRRKGKCEIYHAPFDVRLPSKTDETSDDKIYSVVQPDVCVICDPSKLDDRGCVGAPDLIVEVQSPSTAKRDLEEKFDLYEESGVREYWVVLSQAKTVRVFSLQDNGRYDEGKDYGFDDKAPVGIFDGLEIDLRELFDQ
jgi:Uma2 family endonuclease